jgi:hypothetical protein
MNKRLVEKRVCGNALQLYTKNVYKESEQNFVLPISRLSEEEAFSEMYICSLLSVCFITQDLYAADLQLKPFTAQRSLHYVM